MDAQYKDTPFKFNDECKKAFKILKEKLTCSPMIVSPNWNLLFELMCDASDFVAGAVLGQKDEIKDRKGIENDTTDHLSRIENDESSDDSKVDDNFPGETLMEINTKDESWFADFANYLVANIIPKGITYQQKNKFFSNLPSRKNPTSLKEFENFKQEKEGIEFKIKKFDNASKSLDKLIGSQITDNNKKGLGYHVVPPPHPLIYNGPIKLDLSYSGLDEFKEPKLKSYGHRDSKLESNINHDQKSDNSKENFDDSFVKEQVLEDTSSFVESPLNVDKETAFSVDKKIEFVKPKNYDKPVKKSVRYAEMYRSQRPRGNQRNWNGQKSNHVGSDFVMYNKACFICGSFGHVQINCTHHQRKRRGSGYTYNRVDYNYYAKTTRPSAQRNMTPRIVLLKTGLRPFNNARPVYTAHPKPTGKPQKDDKGFIDSECSRHMTGNIAYLSNFKEFDGGYVTFGGGSHGGRIYGKGNSTEVGTLRYLSLVVLLKKVGDEAVHKKLGDKMERAATTASSLKAKHDTGSGPRFQDTILGDVEGQTSTLEDGKIEITATIDGRIKSITEASIRRHLKLEDSDGITTLPNAKNFEQLALMGASKGYNGVDIPLFPTMLVQGQIDQGVESTVLVKSHHTPTNAPSTSQPPTLTPSMQTTHDAEEPATMPRDSPLPRVQSLRSVKGSLPLNELTGRKIAKIDENPSISLVQDKGTLWIQEHFEIQGRTSADTEILLDQKEHTELVEDLGTGEKGEKDISTVILKVSTAVENLVYIKRSAEKRKDKGKAIIKEDTYVQKKDAEIAKQLQEDIAETDSAHDIDWNDPAVLRYHALQNRSFFVAEVKKNMCIYLKNQGGYKQSHFKEVMKKSRFDLQQKQFAKEVCEKKDDSSSKPVGGSRKKIVAKKRIGAKLDEESAKRQMLKDVTEEEATSEYEKEKDELRLSLKIIHTGDSEVKYKPLSRKFPIVSWEYQLLEKMEAKDMSLVQERFQDYPLEGHNLLLWGDLRMIFDPDKNDELWMNQLDWKFLRWKLHENYGVYTLFMDGARMEINMLVEKKYPLIKELLEKMLKLQLEAEEESTMAFELIKFMKSLLEEYKSVWKNPLSA
nr:DNA-directed DNA polymerase [Tanacetum cinerariifolium]